MRESAILAVAWVFVAALSVQGVPAQAGQPSGEQKQQEQQEQKEQKDKDQKQQKQDQQSELSKGLKPGTAKASDVIDKNVQNPQGENLGKIKDVLVDPKDGKAAFVVFDATSGFFQNLFQGRDHYLILPWEQVTFADGKFTANLDKQQLVQVPSFASDAWPRMDTQYRERVRNYYQQARGPQPQAPSTPQPSARAAQPSSQQADSGQQAGSIPPEAAPQSSQQTASTPSGGQAQSGQPSESAQVQPPEASSGASAPGGTDGQATSGSSSPATGSPSASSGAGGQSGAAGSAGAPSSAAAPPPAQAGTPQADGPKYGKDAILVGDLIRASQFIGKEVRNQQNERLGKVDDLVLDLRSGQVAYTVLAEGGVLGIGEKLFAIPLQAFQAPEGGDRVLLRADREQVAKAPGFDKDNWPTTANPYWTQKSGS